MKRNANGICFLTFPSVFIYAILFCFQFFFVQCSKPTEPEKTEEPKKGWLPATELSSLSVRYMIQLNGYLYASGVNLAVPYSRTQPHYEGERGLVYRTSDGVHWEKVFGIYHEVGPFATHGDTLFLHCDDSIYSYHSSTGWKPKFAGPERLVVANTIGDMVFLGDDLYVMQSLYNNALQTFRISPDGSAVEVKGYYGMYSYAGTKFLKTVESGREKIYVRGAYIGWGFWLFDGSIFTKVMDGLTPRELEEYNPTNSMAYHNDTLFAAFKGPVSVKALINNVWQPYTDTLPSSKSAGIYSPALKTETIAITFAENRMFVSTQCLGVLEYKKHEGWVRMSEGLRVIPEVTDGRATDLWEPVIFLEYFKGYLIAAYGRPAYAPWETSRQNTGVFTYKLGM